MYHVETVGKTKRHFMYIHQYTISMGRVLNESKNAFLSESKCSPIRAVKCSVLTIHRTRLARAYRFVRSFSLFLLFLLQRVFTRAVVGVEDSRRLSSGGWPPQPQIKTLYGVMDARDANPCRRVAREIHTRRRRVTRITTTTTIAAGNGRIDV